MTLTLKRKPQRLTRSVFRVWVHPEASASYVQWRFHRQIIQVDLLRAFDDSLIVTEKVRQRSRVRVVGTGSHRINLL